MKKQKLSKWGWSIFIAIALTLVMAGPVLAQGPGGGLEALAQQIIDWVQTVAVIVGILMLVLWGGAKLLTPVWPQGSQFFNNYGQNFLIGYALIFGGTYIVEGIVGFVSGG